MPLISIGGNYNMKSKEEIKSEILHELSERIDEIFSSEHPPKDLYEMEKIIFEMGSSFEQKALEAIEDYNRKSSKKKLPDMQRQTDKQGTSQKRINNDLRSNNSKKKLL